MKTSGVLLLTTLLCYIDATCLDACADPIEGTVPIADSANSIGYFEYSVSTSGGCSSLTMSCTGYTGAFLSANADNGAPFTYNYNFVDPSGYITVSVTLECSEFGWGAATASATPVGNMFVCESFDPMPTTTTTTAATTTTTVPTTTTTLPTTTTTLPTTTTTVTKTYLSYKITVSAPNDYNDNASTCCPANGAWSEWTFSEPQCRDYCGSCANLTKTRTCISSADGCPCIGDSSVTENCRIDVCYYPRITCCSGYSAIFIDGKHVCGPQSSTGTPDPGYINTCNVSCCPTEGIWGEWTALTACNDTCGSCGRQTMERKCLSTRYGCDCTGPTTKTAICGISVCMYPRMSCCNGYSKILNRVKREYYCGPLPNDTAVATTTCCDPEGTGLWNDWQPWGSCSASCGLCGSQSRTRTCASGAYGCPCVGNSTETRMCPNSPCTNGSMCCSGTYTVRLYDGTYACQQYPPETCTGTWSEWAPNINGGTCNDTCGMCGVKRMRRYCWPSGCTCAGGYLKNDACEPPVCLYPRASCCPGFIKQLNRMSKAYECMAA